MFRKRSKKCAQKNCSNDGQSTCGLHPGAHCAPSGKGIVLGTAFDTVPGCILFLTRLRVDLSRQPPAAGLLTRAVPRSAPGLASLVPSAIQTRNAHASSSRDSKTAHLKGMQPWNNAEYVVILPIALSNSFEHFLLGFRQCADGLTQLQKKIKRQSTLYSWMK